MKTFLRVYPISGEESKAKQINDRQEIVNSLAQKGVILEKWETNQPLSKNADTNEVMSAYAHEIERLKNEKKYDTVDVVSISPQTENHFEARKKFLSEHTHSDDEVRFFVDGTGAFYVRTDESVFALMCTQGDLINLPAGTRHWFDMGSSPFFKAIRFFKIPEGWVGDFTKDTISENFPKYESLVSFCK